MLRGRSGFTLLELLIVITVIGILTAMLTPQLRDVRTRADVRSAQQVVATQLAVARNAAIRRGYKARVSVSGDSITVLVADSTETFTTLSSARSLDDQFGVTLTVSPAMTALDFDPRGFPLTVDSVQRFIVTPAPGSGVKSDTVCVARMGLVRPGGCQL